MNDSLWCSYAIFDVLDDKRATFSAECLLFDLPRIVYSLRSDQYLKVIHLFSKKEIQKNEISNLRDL